MPNLFDFTDKFLVSCVDKQFDKRFLGMVKRYELIETYPDERFVIREGVHILQKLYKIRAVFSETVRIGGIYYSTYMDDVWLDVPCIMED